MLIDQCAQVVDGSDLVEVDADQVLQVSREAPRELLDLPAWDDPGMYDGPEEGVVAWLMSYNAVNYCYWPDRGPRWWTVVDGVEQGRDDEALGIMAAMAHALEGGLPLDDGAWLQQLSRVELDRLFAPAPGAGQLPMLDERLASLHELGRAWARLGGAGGLVRDVGGSALRLVDALTAACPSWEDVRTWRGQTLRFRKRAQLCVAMIHGRLGGEGLGAFHDVDRLTAFADYRLPQILRGVGVLRLRGDLAARIERGELLEAGSPAEVALRAATVHAAELIRQALQARLPEVDALVVDHLLWRSAVDRQDELPPFHRTRTTDY